MHWNKDRAESHTPRTGQALRPNKTTEKQLYLREMTITLIH